MRLLWAAALVLPAFGTQAAVVFTSLHSFQPLFLNGENPYVGLVQGSDGSFYGTTSGGGTNGSGTVFKISATGALTSLYSFTGTNDGANSQGALVQGSDGNFYGTTAYGGTSNAGTVFKISTTGTLTSLYSFTGGDDGANPFAGLVQGSDGNFYGTTSGGGTETSYGREGTVFKITTNGVLTRLHAFNGTDGSDPYGALVQGRDGHFYGTTYGGGTSATGGGTVFKITTNGVLTSLHSFIGGADGDTPRAGLVQASDGNFYGTTSGGGTGTSYGEGTVFRITTNGVLTHLYSFTGASDGAQPLAGLVPGSDGNLYGTTWQGGDNNLNNGYGYGAVFKISTNGTLTPLYSFTGAADGSEPYAGLVQGSDGNFYGTTSLGGTNFAGTVFQITTNGTLTRLYSFTVGPNDGANPQAGLVQGRDGNFYGTTQQGGTNNAGTVFKISTNGTLTSLYSFTYGNDGAFPEARLVQSSDGNFYGTTDGYNPNTETGFGTVFKMTTNGTLTPLYSFTDGTDGANPSAGLVQGSDGSFYGTAYDGGNDNLNGGYGDGAVFKISTNGALTGLYSFTGGHDGAHPVTGLVQGSDGDFYGTTSTGGDTNFNNGQGFGAVFKITTNGVLTSLHSFTGLNDGGGPNGLVQGSDGNFYGTTFSGGDTSFNYGQGFGTVFKITSNGVLTTLHFFAGSNDGGTPVAGLVQGSDGNFYGTANEGGTYASGFNNPGTVFKISTNGTLTTLYSFTGGNDGENSVAVLVQGSDGSFYGTTQHGGQGGVGTVFRLTIVPEFQATTLTNSTLSLTWSREAGGRYQLQYNSDLRTSNWINLSNAVTAAGVTLSATDSITNAPRRFYRVVLSP